MEHKQYPTTATLLLGIYSIDMHVACVPWKTTQVHVNMQKLKAAVEESHKRTTFNSHNNKLACSHVDASQKHQVE